MAHWQNLLRITDDVTNFKWSCQHFIFLGLWMTLFIGKTDLVFCLQTKHLATQHQAAGDTDKAMATQHQAIVFIWSNLILFRL